MNNRDILLLCSIVEYCEDIYEATKQYGSTVESLKESKVLRHAIAMCLLQIGELTVHLSDTFKNEHTDIPWREIRGLRNIVAHHYSRFDVLKISETISEDIPVLHAFCERIIMSDSRIMAILSSLTPSGEFSAEKITEAVYTLLHNEKDSRI